MRPRGFEPSQADMLSTPVENRPSSSGSVLTPSTESLRWDRCGEPGLRAGKLLVTHAVSAAFQGEDLSPSKDPQVRPPGPTGLQIPSPALTSAQPHTNNRRILSWSRRPCTIPMIRRAMLGFVRALLGRTEVAGPLALQLSFRTMDLHAGSLTYPGSTPRGKPYPSIYPPRAATSASTNSSTPMCRHGVFD